MKIKSEPEDFVVEEIADHDLAKGPYTLLRVTKRNMTTEEAIGRIQKKLRTPRQAIGYAGTKDKRAITTQYMTVKCQPQVFDQLSFNGMELQVIGTLREPLGLGMLEQNRFRIVVRALDEGGTRLSQMPNYFDQQRFSVANADIGLLLIKQEYETAAGIVAGSDETYGPLIDAHLAEREHDFVGALKLIPRHTLLLYVHAYQSLLFNEVLSKFIAYNDTTYEQISPAIRLPYELLPSVPLYLIGFDSTMPEPFQDWYTDLLERDGITTRDFVNRQFPYLTLEGTIRQAFVLVENLEMGALVDDPIHSGKKQQVVSFLLPKGSYATIAVQCLYRTALQQ